MYKVKIINLDNCPYLKDKEIGDIITIADYQYAYLKKWVKPLSHFKFVSDSESCPTCKQKIIKRKTQELPL